MMIFFYHSYDLYTVVSHVHNYDVVNLFFLDFIIAISYVVNMIFDSFPLQDFCNYHNYAIEIFLNHCSKSNSPIFAGKV